MVTVSAVQEISMSSLPKPGTAARTTSSASRSMISTCGIAPPQNGRSAYNGRIQDNGSILSANCSISSNTPRGRIVSPTLVSCTLLMGTVVTMMHLLFDEIMSAVLSDSAGIPIIEQQ